MAGTWHGLTHQPLFNTSTMILLTDGRIMVQEEATKHWHALTPVNGSYLNGTWSNLADMSIWRRYYASGVLKDGRVIVCGGEQSGGGGDTTICEIYDPVADSWAIIPSPPGWPTVGDAVCCVLPDGRVMIGALYPSTACAIYNPSTNTWSAAASKATSSNEETWILQPDQTILTTQCWAPYQSEKYIISSNTWQNEGALPVTLVDPVMHEIGPGMLLYNGKTIFFGAQNSGGHGKTAIYTPPALPTGVGTWVAGPDIPQVAGKTIVSNDCPATLLPNGKVLFAGAQYENNDWGSPIEFFEYDPSANTITQAPTPANNGMKLYWSRMMLLPTGEVLFSPSTNNVQLYEPDGMPLEAWRPTISSITPHGTVFFTDYYTLQGTQLNGLSQANIYGDDCYPATNYPIVKLHNAGTGHTYFARTSHFSSMGIATGGALQSCRFTVQGIPDGNYDVCVIANGIASHVMSLNITRFRKPEIIDSGVKREFEYFGKLVFEGDPWDRKDWVVDPQIVEMQQQIKSLSNAVSRLSSLIESRELPHVGKEIAGAVGIAAGGTLENGREKKSRKSSIEV
ncbi:MAG: hypothetical protein Q8916_10510 [Bacteroidota bacterium]|nr:hypothetical protein [Bacteroidota bacterium]MDP4230820.1 hypothetical protein [Bacteroidota bacterium]MDP4236757.1 hypothetical protein [Bacteroidota bacterium]